MSHDFQDELTSRLIRYCKIDSQSDADSQSSPSTDIQLDMQHLLMSELKEIGAQGVAHPLWDGSGHAAKHRWL